MLNVFLSNSDLFLFSLVSCFVILVVRKCFISRIRFNILYHACWVLFFLFSIVGGAGIQNFDYDALEKFIVLEKNGQLEDYQKNPDKYNMQAPFPDSSFETSDEYRKYIQQWDSSVDKSEAMGVGWLFALMAELASLCASFLIFITHRMRKRNSTHIHV